jgi:hypothetical protein
MIIKVKISYCNLKLPLISGRNVATALDLFCEHNSSITSQWSVLNVVAHLSDSKWCSAQSPNGARHFTNRI